MPHIDSEVYDFSHRTAFATLDVVSDYWFLPIAANLQEAHSIITHGGTRFLTRTQQGATNIDATFQSKVGLVVDFSWAETLGSMPLFCSAPSDSGFMRVQRDFFSNLYMSVEHRALRLGTHHIWQREHVVTLMQGSC